MSIQKQICEAFCDGFRIEEVPIGYAIVSPFTWLDDEPLVIYAAKSGNQIRLQDSGASLLSLEDISGDLSSDARMDTMRELSAQHKVFFDEENYSFNTDWRNENDIGGLVVEFLSFMNRLQDMQFFSKNRVENAFKDDLFAAINDSFKSGFVVSERADISKGYISDISVLSEKTGKMAAVYAATAEVKVLEALLTAELVSHDPQLSHTTPFLIYENLFNSKITQRNRQRSANSEVLQVADWSGGKGEIIEKINYKITRAA